MATLIDSYNESNQNTYFHLCSDASYFQAGGQSFTGNGGILDSCKFYLRKINLPTGNATAKIYLETHATAFGTDSLPTGAALATSLPFDVSTLTTSFQLITFFFDGLDQIPLVSGTKYVVTIEYSGGDYTNNVFVGLDTTSPTHSGNTVNYTTPTWNYESGWDTIFYVYETIVGPFPTHFNA